MTAGAQHRKAKGVVISGRCRDLAEHREAGFPVFSRGHSTLGQSPFVRPSAVQVPVTIAPLGDSIHEGLQFPAITVRPGDMIVADEDGVVCIPLELVRRTAEVAGQGREADARCMEDISAGKGVKETFARWRGK